MSLRPGWKMRFCFTQNLKPNQHTHIHISLINTNTINICSNILHEEMCGKQTPELSKNYINSALMDDNEGHFAVTPPVALHDCLTFLCPLVTIWQAEHVHTWPDAGAHAMVLPHGNCRYVVQQGHTLQQATHRL